MESKGFRIILLCTVLTIVWGQIDVKGAVQQCKRSFPGHPINDIFDGSYSSYKVKGMPRPLTCFLHCLLRLTGVAKVNDIDFEALRRTIEHNSDVDTIITEIKDKCPTSADTCEHSAKLYQCIDSTVKYYSNSTATTTASV